MGLPTSSSLKAIMETARKTASVEPVMVVMRSGQDPSEMVMRALLWGQCHTPSGVLWDLSSMFPHTGKGSPGVVLMPADLGFPPPTCPRQPSPGCSHSFPGATNKRGGQGWARGSHQVLAGQAAGSGNPPACPYLLSYPLNRLSFLRGEEHGGWSGPGEPGPSSALDPKSYLPDDAANFLQRQRRGWPH